MIFPLLQSVACCSLCDGAFWDTVWWYSVAQLLDLYLLAQQLNHGNYFQSVRRRSAEIKSTNPERSVTAGSLKLTATKWATNAACLMSRRERVSA